MRRIERNTARCVFVKKYISYKSLGGLVEFFFQKPMLLNSEIFLVSRQSVTHVFIQTSLILNLHIL